MSRKRSTAPAMICHASGQARVTLDGTSFYLGKYGTSKAVAKYHALLAVYNANGQKMPTGTPTHQIDEPVRVRDVIADYRARELPRYEHNEGSHTRKRNILAKLEQLFGEEPIDTLGPLKIDSLRDELIKTGNSRRYINDQIRDVVVCLQHGAARELVPIDKLTAIERLPRLRRGQAPEPAKRPQPQLADVVAAMQQMHPSLADAIQLQMATACRPSEIWRLEPAMIDRSGDEWLYRPERHKTRHHGKERIIPIVGIGREILEPYLFAEGLCFVNQRGNQWNRNSYRHAVHRACDRASVARFAPYDLRHLSAQRVRDALGAEHVQALLGHAKLSTVELYSQPNTERAIEAAKAIDGIA